VAQFRVKRRNRFGQISDHRQLTGPNTIQLRGINFEVNDFCVGGKARRLAGYAIIQPRSETISKSVSCSAILAARVPCIPTMPR